MLYDDRAVAVDRVGTVSAQDAAALWIRKRDLPRVNDFELKPQRLHRLREEGRADGRRRAFQFINVPMGVWLDEQGRIVRPAEPAWTATRTDVYGG